MKKFGRVAILQTADGLGIYIGPQRQIAVVLFLIVWLAVWGLGERWALSELFAGGFPLPGLLVLPFVVIWSLAGIAVFLVVIWQLLGAERIFHTGGALVHQTSILRRKVIDASTIKDIRIASGSEAGPGTIIVETTAGKSGMGVVIGRDEALPIVVALRRSIGLDQPEDDKGSQQAEDRRE